MRRLSILLLAITLPAAQPAAATCTLTKLTSFDADISSGRIIIHVQIDGQVVAAMLDTALPFNMISKNLVEKLSLSTVEASSVMMTPTYSYYRKNLAVPSLPPEDLTMMDASGGTPKRLTKAHTVAFGDIKTGDTPFYVMGEPDKGGSAPDVIFGANFLETYDLELDLAHGKVNVFFPNHCPGAVVYWSNRFGEVPIKISSSGHITLPVAVNGLESHAIVDTGAPLSLISKKSAADDLHIDPTANGDKLEYITTPSGGHLPFYRHTFDSFDFGGAHFNQTALGIAPDRLNWAIKNNVHDPQGALLHEETINTPITLGMNHIEKLRIYFSFKENMLYFTGAYAGD